MASEWRKRPPDSVGYWLLINRVDKPTITWAMKIDGILNVLWGSGPDATLLHADHSKLFRWWWKRLELPPEVNPNVCWKLGQPAKQEDDDGE